MSSLLQEYMDLVWVVIIMIIIGILCLIFTPLLALWCLKMLGAPITYSFGQWAAAAILMAMSTFSLRFQVKG